MMASVRQVAPSGGQICNQFKKFHSNQFQTILVMDSIPWVRCASGNVFILSLKTLVVLHWGLTLVSPEDSSVVGFPVAVITKSARRRIWLLGGDFGGAGQINTHEVVEFKILQGDSEKYSWKTSKFKFFPMLGGTIGCWLIFVTTGTMGEQCGKNSPYEKCCICYIYVI